MKIAINLILSSFFLFSIGCKEPANPQSSSLSPTDKNSANDNFTEPTKRTSATQYATSIEDMALTIIASLVSNDPSLLEPLVPSDEDLAALAELVVSQTSLQALAKFRDISRDEMKNGHKRAFKALEENGVNREKLKLSSADVYLDFQHPDPNVEAMFVRRLVMHIRSIDESVGHTIQVTQMGIVKLNGKWVYISENEGFLSPFIVEKIQPNPANAERN